MPVDPQGVALEYINTRDSMIERHKGAGRSLLGNASRVTQLQFIEMCNRYATKFADQMPLDWNLPDWEKFGNLSMPLMTRELDTIDPQHSPVTLTMYEGMRELAYLYAGLLRQRETPA